VTATDEKSWQQAVKSLFASHLELVEAIKSFGDERLTEKVPGRTYAFYYLFHGWNQHAVYHGGQIALLKRISLKRKKCLSLKSGRHVDNLVWGSHYFHAA